MDEELGASESHSGDSGLPVTIPAINVFTLINQNHDLSLTVTK